MYVASQICNSRGPRKPRRYNYNNYKITIGVVQYALGLIQNIHGYANNLMFSLAIYFMFCIKIPGYWNVTRSDRDSALTSL